MDGWMMDGWMDGWMDEYVCMNMYVRYEYVCM